MKKTVQNQEPFEWHSHLGTATESSVVMSPSCPSLPAPQENSWPRSLRARLWASPHATCMICWSASAPICSERDQDRGRKCTDWKQKCCSLHQPPSTVWPTPSQEGMRVCLGSQWRGPGAAGWREHQLWLLTHSWEDSLQCWHLPLVPESRTPAYRMVSPTCRVFHPQKHPQNIPRCLSPRWSETRVLTMKTNHSDHHPRQFYFIKRTGTPVGLQKNLGDLSVEEWHFHTCI